MYRILGVTGNTGLIQQCMQTHLGQLYFEEPAYKLGLWALKFYEDLLHPD